MPEQYVGLRFVPELVPRDLNPRYASKLEELHNLITSVKLRQHNLCICSPNGHSKTVWAYSCIQNLFRQRVPVSPILDILELRRMIDELSDGDELYDAPYLFLRVPTEVTHSIRCTMTTILDRRVRRGNSTIFLYGGSWGMLTYGDRFGTIRDLQGDGSFTSIEVINFKKENTDVSG